MSAKDKLKNGFKLTMTGSADNVETRILVQHPAYKEASCRLKGTVPGRGPWRKVDGVQVTLSVGEDSRVFDCAALQGDGQVTVDVVRGIGGKLTEGVENGTEYVANLIIPPARYEDVPLPVTLAEVEVPDDLDPMCISSVLLPRLSACRWEKRIWPPCG